MAKTTRVGEANSENHKNETIYEIRDFSGSIYSFGEDQFLPSKSLFFMLVTHGLYDNFPMSNEKADNITRLVVNDSHSYV